MRFPTVEEMAKEVAEKALDEYVYEGKTIRQWVEVLKDYDDKKSTMERIVERLEEKRTEYEKISEQKYFDMPQACYYKGYEEGFKGAIKICKEEGGIE